MYRRCSYVNLKNPEYIKYHDLEWCIPKHDDKELFELLVLEGFQAGLSWECILNKRKNFRKAFDEGPVYFDSALNHSNYGWTFGNAPCMFARTLDHVECLSKSIQPKFKDQEFYLNDEYLGDLTKDLFDKSKNDAKTKKKLESDKLVFYYQFVASDSYGHGWGPASNEYFEQMIRLSKLFERIQGYFDDYYNSLI